MKKYNPRLFVYVFLMQLLIKSCTEASTHIKKDRCYLVHLFSLLCFVRMISPHNFHVQSELINPAMIRLLEKKKKKKKG